MGIVHLNGPTDATGKCVICLAEAKQKQWETSQDEINAGSAASGDKTTYIPWPRGLDNEIQDGRYRGIAGAAPQMGVIDGLCWDHMAGVQEQKPASALTQEAVIPPGLLRGGR